MVSRRVVVCLFACCFLAAGFSSAKVYHYQYQKIIEVESPLELTINSANGSIVLTTNSDNQLKVDAVKNIRADSREEADLVADHVQVNVENADGHFTIEPHFMRMQDRSPTFWQKILGKSGEQAYGSVDFVISVPVDCNVDIYNTAGDIEAAGLRGRVVIAGTDGDVELRDHIGDLDITTTSGLLLLKDIEGKAVINANGSDISLFGLTGDIEIRNSAGKTTGEYIVGDITVSQTLGEIDLRHLEGDTRIKSTSGRIRLEQDFGALDISTESGNIAVKTELNSNKDFFVETVSGSIRFMIPEASGGEVQLEAGSGDIDTRIPISIDSFSRTRISGRFGTGGPKISLMTRSGEIVLDEF